MKHRVLIVEDAGTFRELEVSLLSRIDNIKIDLAVNYRDCIAHIEKNTYDLILCDHNLPDGKGFEILKTVRKNNMLAQDGCAVPFVMITGDSDVELVKASISEGVSDYMVKPFQPMQFIEKCCHYLGVAKPKF